MSINITASKHSSRSRWLRQCPIVCAAALMGARTVQGVTFAPSVSYAAGTSPYAVVAADLDGDARNDLIVADSGSGQISVLKAVSGGTYAAGVNYAAGTRPYAVAAGDFNGDGFTDIAVANNGANNVSVLLGNGNGTLQSAVNYAAGNQPWAIVAADFNGDSKLDLAVVNNLGNNISILIGNGNGTFASAVNYSAGTGPMGLAVGDFNGDGYMDLAVVNRTSNTLGILLGNGNGTFQSQVTYGTGSKPHAVAVGDLNNDGKADIVVANTDDYTVSIRLGNGNGTFGAKTDYTAGIDPWSIAIVDVNGDAILDLVVANSGDNNVAYYQGTGTGTFAGRVNFTTATRPYGVIGAQVNSDGLLDIVTANNGGNNVSVLLNTTPRASAYSYSMRPGSTAWANASMSQRYSACIVPSSYVSSATTDGLVWSAINNPFSRVMGGSSSGAFGDVYQRFQAGSVGAIFASAQARSDFGPAVVRYLQWVDLNALYSNDCLTSVGPCVNDYITAALIAGFSGTLDQMTVSTRQTLLRLAVFDANFFETANDSFPQGAAVKLMYMIYNKPASYRGNLPASFTLPTLSSQDLYELERGTVPATVSAALPAARTALGVFARP